MAPLIFVAPLPNSPISAVFVVNSPDESRAKRGTEEREKEGIGDEGSALNTQKEGSEESEDVDLTLE